MSNTKEQYEKEILAIIAEYPDICFIQEIFCEYSGCCSATFYNFELEKLESIKSALEQNRTNIKREMRGNWKKKNAGPALQVSAYKLMGNDDERKRLSQQYTELSTKDDKPISVGINWIPSEPEDA